MELRLCRVHDGLPDDALLSVRVGAKRKIATLAENVWAMPIDNAEGPQAVSIKIFSPIAQARMMLDASRSSRQFPVLLGAVDAVANDWNSDYDDGDCSLEFQLTSDMLDDASSQPSRPVSAEKRSPQNWEGKGAVGSASRRHRQAITDTKPYLEEHHLVGIMQSLMQALSKDRPADPYQFMVSMLENTLRSHTATPRSRVSRPPSAPLRRFDQPAFGGGTKAQRPCSARARTRGTSPPRQSLETATDLTASLATKEHELWDVRSKMKAQEAELDNLRPEAAEFHGRLVAAEAEVARLQLKLAAALEASRADEAREEANSARKEAHCFAAEAEKARLEQEEAETQRSSLLRELDLLKCCKTEERSLMEMTVKKLQAEVDSAKTEVTVLEVELAHQKDHAKNMLESEFRVESLTAKLGEALLRSAKMDELESQMETLSSDIEGAMTSSAQMHERLKVSELELQATAMDSTKLHASECRVANLEQELADSAVKTNQLEDVVSQAANLKDELHEATNKFEEVDAMCRSLEDQLQDATLKVAKAHEAEIMATGLEVELDMVKRNSAASLDEAEVKCLNLTFELESALRRAATQQDAESQVAKLREELEGATAKSAQLNDAQTKIAVLELELHEARRERECLREVEAKCSNLEEKLRSEGKKAAKVEDAETSVAEMETALREVCSRLVGVLASRGQRAKEVVELKGWLGEHGEEGSLAETRCGLVAKASVGESLEEEPSLDTLRLKSIIGELPCSGLPGDLLEKVDTGKPLIERSSRPSKEIGVDLASMSMPLKRVGKNDGDASEVSLELLEEVHPGTDEASSRTQETERFEQLRLELQRALLSPRGSAELTKLEARRVNVPECEDVGEEGGQSGIRAEEKERHVIGCLERRRVVDRKSIGDENSDGEDGGHRCTPETDRFAAPGEREGDHAVGDAMSH